MRALRGTERQLLSMLLLLIAGCQDLGDFNFFSFCVLLCTFSLFSICHLLNTQKNEKKGSQTGVLIVLGMAGPGVSPGPQPFTGSCD